MRKKINEIFDGVYVVSFEGSSRLKTLSDRLNGIDYKVFYGVHKDDIDVDRLDKEGYTGHGIASKYSTGSLACCFSHFYLYKYLKENNLNNILILEDDVIVIDSALENLYKSYEVLPENWDLFYLGMSNHNRNWDNILRKQLNYKNLVHKAQQLEMGTVGLQLLEGTNAYAVNNKFLDIAIEKQSNPKTMNPVADGLLFWLYYKLEIFACIPQPFPQVDNKFFFYDNNIGTSTIGRH